jgi:hypothetical protein
VEEKIDSRLIPKSVSRLPIEKFDSPFKKTLFPQFVEIHQHRPAIKVSASARKSQRISYRRAVVRK